MVLSWQIKRLVLSIEPGRHAEQTGGYYEPTALWVAASAFSTNCRELRKGTLQSPRRPTAVLNLRSSSYAFSDFEEHAYEIQRF